MGKQRTWPAPHASEPVHATVIVPGSKSLTNRTLVLSALAAAQGSGESTIGGALFSRDTELMIGALRTLGLDIDGDATKLTVAGRVSPSVGARVDCGLAGTVLRFVPPLAALGEATVEFDGDEQARTRPVAPLLSALRSLGVDIDRDAMPFRVAGTGSVKGGTVAIDASASSQFVSGLLLSGAAFTDGLTIEHVGDPMPSAPHVDMTVAMLRQAGIDVDDSNPDRWEVAGGRIAARRWDIEPDLSNAVPFLSAAAVTGGTVRVLSLPGPSLQPVQTVARILGLADATVAQSESYLEVRGAAEYGGFDADLHDVGELAPAVAVLAALAVPGSVSRLSGIAHLRGHETDRLAALSTEINLLGGQCEQTADGLLITATALHAGTWHSYADHRMAMAGAIAGLAVPGLEIDDVETTSKTLPGFAQLWADMLGEQGQGED